MMPTEDYVLSRIAKIILEPSYDSMKVCDALENLHIEAKQARSERGKESYERAMNEVYVLLRVGYVDSFNYQGHATRQKKTLETAQVKRRDLATWAKAHDVKLDDLLLLIEYRRTPAKAKDGTQWELPLMYPENSNVTYEAWDEAESKRIEEINKRRQAGRPQFENLGVIG